MFVFITVTLNPAVDVMIDVKNLETEKHVRLLDKKKIAGGKGINISKVLKSLGEKTFVTGFVGGANGKYIEKTISKMHIDHQFIHVDKETRENIKIFDQEKSTTYEINEAGPQIDLAKFDELIMLLKSIIKKNDVVVISGSAPFNYDVDVYKVMIESLKPLCKEIILDTSKDWLKVGLTAKPHLIKPNLEELEFYTKKNLTSDKEIIEEALKIIASGVNEVLVSLGKRGSLYVSKDHQYKITVPDLKVNQTVGAGDALLAGFLSSKYSKPLEEALVDAAFTSLSYIADIENETEIKEKIQIVNK
jgi:1-phosphofructokinase family hexose kinase